MAIDPVRDPYVLLGRLATMGTKGTIDNGALYIRGEEIVAVKAENDAPPDGFENAKQVRTGGTIYPGLIELHNHLSYNAIPLWEVQKQYAHSGSWQGTDEYKIAVTKPAAVLANTAGNAEALVRFAECRCLLGGVTSSQGVTLQSNAGVRKLYKGLVRNVEAPMLEGVRGAKTRIGAPDKNECRYLEKLERETCYLQHLSEGTTATARSQFLGLRQPDGNYALHKSFCGVHSTALLPEDFEILAENGCSIVWSPLSNLLLYGQTTDVAAAKAAGVPIALGSDWSPSGTKNLLGELKVAKVVSDHLGVLFKPEELCAMVTTIPAKILGWDQKIGCLDNGKVADLVVVDDTTTDNVFEQLINARETSLTLVVIGGIPRVGQRRLMHKFGGGSEEIRVGDSVRVIDLTTRPGDADLGDLTLTEATARLADTLENLPQCAEDLENAIASGWVPGHAVTASGIDIHQLPEDWQEPRVRVVLEFEEEDSSGDFLDALQAGDLADWVEPMRLDPITVADDPTFLKRLLRAKNLPRYVKENLPALHGVHLSVPTDEASGADSDRAADPLASVELSEFLAEEHYLPLDDRLRIVEQAILLLERYYVHLPMKRTHYAVDPVQRLRILAHELSQRGNDPITDLELHREVIAAFDSMRDLHTAYRLPRPYRAKIAWLPYQIEECRAEGRGEPRAEPEGPPPTRFIVSKVIGDPGPESFVPGVEVLYWNGVPINRAVASLARQMPGSNPAARRARAMNSLTLRSLSRGQIPDEEWVTLHYRAETGRLGRFKHPWLLFEPSPGRHSLSPEQLGVLAATELGLDDQTDDLHQAKKLFFATPEALEDEREATPGEEVAKRRAAAKRTPRDLAREPVLEIPTRMPTVFRARRVVAEGSEDNTHPGEYGYLRIFTFNVDDADLFVDELAELLAALPPEGLILDLRGNGGGLISAAERALELLSPHPIQPQPAQFINTMATLELCRNHRDTGRLPGLDLEPWLDSMNRAVASGASHSLAVPITPAAECNRKGQIYQGPKVLIQDGLCYSAADMFIAGFQDHGLGQIIGCMPTPEPAEPMSGPTGCCVTSRARDRDCCSYPAGRIFASPSAAPCEWVPTPVSWWKTSASSRPGHTP